MEFGKSRIFPLLINPKQRLVPGLGDRRDFVTRSNPSERTAKTPHTSSSVLPRLIFGIFMVAIATTIPISATSAGDLDTAIGLVLRMNEAAAQSQKRVDKLDDQATDLLAQFRDIQRQIIASQEYNEQTQRLVDTQEREIAEIEKDIAKTTYVKHQVTPLLKKMVVTLEKFIELDIPFLSEERRQRVEKLKGYLDNPNVAEAEKYKQIMDAYLIETEYGHTIDAYKGTLTEPSGTERTVEFLRVGRVALIYRTIKGSEIKAWDKETKSWLPLGSSYQSAIKKGFRIAQKQAAPDLVPIPVPAPKEVAQ